MSTIVKTPHGSVRITDHAIDQARERLNLATPEQALQRLKRALNRRCIGVVPQPGNALLIETDSAGLILTQSGPGRMIYLVTVLAPHTSRHQHQIRGQRAPLENIA